jgi:iron complex outermembrane recepter protein
VSERASLFLGYGHGMRLPDPQERYMALTGMMGKPAWVGNPALDPSRSDELDLGGKVVAGGVLLKAQVYHAWVADHVTLANRTVTTDTGTLTSKTYENVAARLYGGEASARVALPRDLYASGSLTYTRGENETAGTPLAEIPPLRASVALRWDVSRVFVEVEEQWAARQDRVDPALSEQPTSAWYVTNARVGGEWKGVKAFVGVRNAFDKLYYEHLSYQRDPFATGTKVPEPGRTLYLNLQYAL